MITDDAVRYHPDPTKEYALHVDASMYACCALLVQDGHWIYALNHVFSASEIKW